MTVPEVFESCWPRLDVLAGAVKEADFAADLAQVIGGEGTADYLDPLRFFANSSAGSGAILSCVAAQTPHRRRGRTRRPSRPACYCARRDQAGCAKRILILTLKAFLGQWQTELREKFNFNWPIYGGVS